MNEEGSCRAKQVNVKGTTFSDRELATWSEIRRADEQVAYWKKPHGFSAEVALSALASEMLESRKILPLARVDDGPVGFACGGAARIQSRAVTTTLSKMARHRMTCTNRAWLEDDETMATGPVCGAIATHYSCNHIGPNPTGLNACKEHKCRCNHPKPKPREEPATSEFVILSAFDAAVMIAEEIIAEPTRNCFLTRLANEMGIIYQGKHYTGPVADEPIRCKAVRYEAAAAIPCEACGKPTSNRIVFEAPLEIFASCAGSAICEDLQRKRRKLPLTQEPCEQPNVTKARLDLDGDAKPKTEIVGGVFSAGQKPFYDNAESLVVRPTDSGCLGCGRGDSSRCLVTPEGACERCCYCDRVLRESKLLTKRPCERPNMSGCYPQCPPCASRSVTVRIPNDVLIVLLLRRLLPGPVRGMLGVTQDEIKRAEEYRLVQNADDHKIQLGLEER